MKTSIDNPSIRGKFLWKHALRSFTDDFVDADTGEIVSIERNEIVVHKGAFLDDLTISLLKENGVREIEVCNERRLGNWMECYTKWEVTASVPRVVGTQNKVITEMYLTRVSSAAEAESQIIDELEKSCSGDFKIHKIQVSKIDEVIFADGDCWFKATIKYPDVDGKELKMTILVRSSDIDSASEVLKKDNTLPDSFTLSEIKDTKFIDVYGLEDQA